MSHRCLPHVVAAWTGWVCPCGHAIADHANTPEGYCLKCRCPKAYLGRQDIPESHPTRDDVVITVGGVELVETPP
jgi:hypothetical protein